VTPQIVVVVTGLSGAGKTTAVAALEDLGFFCVDNMPIPVVELTLDSLWEHDVDRVALGIDVRVGAFLELAPTVVDNIKSKGMRSVSVLFLDAADDVLIRRFGSTRRPHPLSTSAPPGAERGATAVLDGITIERSKLAPLRALASVVIDTSALSIHELRRAVIARYDYRGDQSPKLNTRIVSFGFKYGLPMDADMVLDVRFLKNPYFVDSMRTRTGLDLDVSDYVLETEDGKALLEHALSLIRYCIPQFEREGKSHVTIAIGCTGGRHRSVAVAQAIASRIHRPPLWPVELVHRDVERDLEHDRAQLNQFQDTHPIVGGFAK